MIPWNLISYTFSTNQTTNENFEQKLEIFLHVLDLSKVWRRTCIFLKLKQTYFNSIIFRTPFFGVQNEPSSVCYSQNLSNSPLSDGYINTHHYWHNLHFFKVLHAHFFFSFPFQVLIILHHQILFHRCSKFIINFNPNP